MPSPQPIPGRCCAKTRGGGFCTQYPIQGTKRCRTHPGSNGRRGAMAKGAVVIEAKKWGWGLDDTTKDPGEYLLRLVAQSWRRVEKYADLLQQAYEAADRLQAAHDAEQLIAIQPDARYGGDDEERPPHPAQQAAAQDLRRIFTTGGVAALIGYQYDATKDGDLYATGEAIRGLAQLELQERRFGMELSAKAIAAGLAERMVRLAERQGALMAQFVTRVAERLGLTDVQQAALPGAIEAEVINMTEGAAA